MSKPLLKYTLHLTQVTRYDWTAVVADMTGEKPSGTSILAKSLPELLAKCLVAVVLREKNASIIEEAPTNSKLEVIAPPGVIEKIAVNPRDMPLIFPAPKRIITPNGE